MKTLRVLNLGAGVQSTTLDLMCRAGLLPDVDVAIFADTGDETEETYRHLQWLESLPGHPILRRSRGCLGDDLLRGENATGQRFASIPVFTWLPDSDREGRLKRQCSKEYKVEVIEKTIRHELLGLPKYGRIPKDVQIVQLIGISLDEAGRAERIARRRTLGVMEFPLLKWRMTRFDCLEWLRGRVPHRVPRSSCVYCPNRQDAEWAELKAKGGKDWARAVAIDEGLRVPGVVANRGMDADMFVHRSCEPLVQIDFRSGDSASQPSLGFYRECLGACGL